jgi:RNA polymerase sigma factor (sigma-70 family)
MLPWPRCAADGTPLGVDLAAPGLTARTKTIADDVRRLVLSRWVGNAARLLDPDDLVQEVHRRIIRRNRRPCAFDPRQGSIGHYVYQVTSGAIADMLKPAKRRAEQERLTLDTCDFPEPVAPEPDAPLDLDAAPSEPDAREDFFLALCCLEVLDELPVKEPLWQRALRQREKEQARARAAAKREREREERRAAKRAATRAATQATREQKRSVLDGEVLAFIQSETAQGRPVPCSELAAMLGLHPETVRVMLERLAKAGTVEVRRLRGSRRATCWALPEQAGAAEAAPLLPVETEPAPELASEALPEANATTAIPLGLELTEEPALVALEPLPSAAEEPATPPPSLSALPAPASWPHRRLNSKRLHVSFPAVDIAMFAPPSPESLRAVR